MPADRRPAERAVRRPTWVALSAALVCLFASASAGAQTAPLDALLTRMAGISAFECRFHEEKRIALLSSPIVTDGTIHYVRPGRMARRVSVPATQVMLIEGTRLRMWDGSREESIDLAEQPVVRSFVDSVISLLAGDRAALERSYTLALSSSTEGHVLTLTPRARPLSQFITSIRFSLSPTYDLTRMEMNEVSGDSTITTFSAVDDHRRYSPAELDRIFSLR